MVSKIHRPQVAPDSKILDIKRYNHCQELLGICFSMKKNIRFISSIYLSKLTLLILLVRLHNHIQKFLETFLDKSLEN